LLLLLLLPWQATVAAAANFLRAAVGAAAQHCSCCRVWTATSRRCYSWLLLLQLLLLQLLVHSCHPSSTLLFWHCPEQRVEVVICAVPTRHIPSHPKLTWRRILCSQKRQIPCRCCCCCAKPLLLSTTGTPLGLP
jgi:hypothetical protein